MLNVNEILKLHEDCVIKWHTLPAPDNNYDGILQTICEEHKYNYLLWHQEDMARDPHATDSQIASIKRNIDILNQKRNDYIEIIDQNIISLFLKDIKQFDNTLPLNSETPGSIIDRLSILSLRIYHMKEQTNRQDVTPEHILKAQNKLKVIYEQQRDLATSLEQLLLDIKNKKKRLKIYYQYKMYNDPTLNPQIYQKK